MHVNAIVWASGRRYEPRQKSWQYVMITSQNRPGLPNFSCVMLKNMGRPGDEASLPLWHGSLWGQSSVEGIHVEGSEGMTMIVSEVAPQTTPRDIGRKTFLHNFCYGIARLFNYEKKNYVTIIRPELSTPAITCIYHDTLELRHCDSLREIFSFKDVCTLAIYTYS